MKFPVPVYLLVIGLFLLPLTAAADAGTGGTSELSDLDSHIIYNCLGDPPSFRVRNMKLSPKQMRRRGGTILSRGTGLGGPGQMLVLPNKNLLIAGNGETKLLRRASTPLQPQASTSTAAPEVRYIAGP